MSRIRPNQPTVRPSTKRCFVLLVILFTTVGCRGSVWNPRGNSLGDNPGKPTTTLTVFAAASLTESFLDIADRFEADNPGVKLDFNFAGSQQLSQQLVQGATADLFASADKEYIDSLVEAGILDKGSEQIFANNRLAVIFRKDGRIPIHKLEDLASPGVHLVIGAESVPIGRHSLEFLERISSAEAFGPTFKDDILRNVMSYEENVKAVLSKVILGEADAGIVYDSDTLTLDPGEIGVIPIPEAYNPIARYYIAALPASANQDLSSRFIEFILSATGQEILKSNGLIPVQ